MKILLGKVWFGHQIGLVADLGTVADLEDIVFGLARLPYSISFS